MHAVTFVGIKEKMRVPMRLGRRWTERAGRGGVKLVLRTWSDLLAIFVSELSAKQNDRSTIFTHVLVHAILMSHNHY